MDDSFGANDADFRTFLESTDLDKLLTDPPVVSPTRRPQEGSLPVQQPKPQALPGKSGPAAILVSARQKGNPILNHIRLLPWEYADIPADYVVGATTCALFLSLKYHRLHPEYIYSRIRLLHGKYKLRILLTMVDIPNHEDSLKELSKTSLVNNLTLVLCWSAPEAAHYLELFKSCEHAEPTGIRSQQAQTYQESLVEFVTVPRSINKSDAASLISTFGSLQAAINARPEQISMVPGWGDKKVKQWCGAVREEFRTRKAARKTAAPQWGLGSAVQVNEVTGQSLDDLVENDKLASREVEVEAQAEPSVSALGGVGHMPSLDASGIKPAQEQSQEISELTSTDRYEVSRDTSTDGIMAALSKLRDQGGG